MEYADTAILTTLSYSDIFDFPLSKEELWKFLVGKRKITRSEFEKKLIKLEEKLDNKYGYYYLKGREKILQRRIFNLKEVEKKLKIAKNAADWLSIIPSVLFIGISGGLAMGDATKEDDIFIITKKQKLFATRFWILFILTLLGLRRTRSDKNPRDKICVNLLIDESKLAWDSRKSDLYTAHEILQLKPLFERKNIYINFIKSNIWIESYFPNAEILDKENLLEVVNIKSGYFKKVLGILIGILSPENMLRFLQTAYMNDRGYSKSTSSASLAFHPNDYRVQTLNKLNLKMQELGLLTNS